MAYAYRTPAQLFFSSLPSEDQSNVNRPSVKNLESYQKRNSSLYSYHMTDVQSAFCTKVGVPLSINPFLPHPHPYSKTIENFILFDNVENYLSKIDNFVSMKESKYVRLSDKSRSSFHRLINRAIADRDKLRYENFSRRKEISDLANIGSKDQSWFFHDELHHWSLSDLISFFGTSKPKRVIASIVCPVEVFESENSMNPNFYTFKIIKRHSKDCVSFIYNPDGSRESSYFQKSFNFWFKYRKIRVFDECYTISFLRSIKSHHLILIERGDLATSPLFISDNAECISAKVFGFTRHSNTFLPIRYDVLKKEIIYLLSLKKCDSQSACAKLRQLSDDGYSGAELAFFYKFAEQLSKNKVFDRVGLFTSLYESFADLFPERVNDKISSTFAARQLEKFIMGAEPYHLTVERKEYPSLDDFEGVSLNPSFVLNLIDEKFFGSELPIDTSYSMTQHEVFMTDAELFALQESGRRKAHERSLNRIDPVDNSQIQSDELSPEEARFYNRHAMPGEIIFCRGDRVFKKTTPGHFGQKLLTDFPHVEYTADEVREVEMCDAFDIEDVMDTDDDVLDLPISECSSDFNLEDPTFFIGDGQFATGKLIVSDKWVKLIRESLGSCNAVIHNGRRAVFHSEVANLTYGFGDISYKCVKFDHISELISMINGKTNLSFNTCLIQEYRKGGKIGFHRDDEACYEPYPILTVNLVGEACFTIEGHCSYDLKDHDVIMMRNQEKRHGVESLSDGRISMTFRKQVRFMDGRPIKSSRVSNEICIPDNFDEKLANMSNACFIDCIGEFLKMDRPSAASLLVSIDRSWINKILNDLPVNLPEMINSLTALGIPGAILSNGVRVDYLKEGSYSNIFLVAKEGHVSLGEIDTAESSSLNFEGLCKSNLSVIKPNYSCERARVLIKSFQDGATGVLLNRFKYGFNLISQRFIKTFIVAGFAGSGKSKSIQDILCTAGNAKNTLFISPRLNLLNDWERKIKDQLNGRPLKAKLRTYETGLKALCRLAKMGSKVNIILDEATLLPGGYLDLCSCLSPEGSTMVIIADPCQASYYSDSDKTRKLGSSLKPIEGQKYPYLYRTFRFPKLFNVEGLIHLNNGEVHGLHMHEFGSAEAAIAKVGKVVFLCPSEDKRVELERYGEAYTFGTSQGLTFDFVVISLDMDGPLVSNSAWMVALTRARRGFAFLNCPSIRRSDFLSRTEGKLINKVLKRQEVSINFIKASGGLAMEGADFVQQYGRTREEFEDQLSGDPWLKAQLLFLEAEDCAFDVPEPLRKESPPKTHLVLGTDAMAYIEGPGMVMAREKREFRNGKIWSCQFDDTKSHRSNLQNQAESFENVYPRHSNSDDLTFAAAVKKRLKFSDPFSERRKLEKFRDVGSALFDIFVREYSLKPRRLVHDEDIDHTFIEKRLSKSSKLIEAHSTRSDPDWPINHFFLFMKSQLCTKFEKRLCAAKAGQTLACFSHKVLCRFGIPIRLFEKNLREQLGDHIYIHSGKQLDELNEWAMKYCQDNGTDSDYEAFDRSQDALILAFEIPLLKFLGWTQDLIDDYVNMKLNLGCKLGNLAIMRFTGEFGTFILNTCCNMLFTALRYEIKGRAIAFAGDDMFAPGRLKIRNDLSYLIDRFSLKAKVNFSSEPIFCGWRMTKFGIVKEPKLVLERFMIARERGNFNECLINYCLEASFAYRLGERLYDVISNIEDFQLLVRIVVKNKHLLPKKVKSEFESFDHEFGGCEQVPEKGDCLRVHSFGCGLECNL